MKGRKEEERRVLARASSHSGRVSRALFCCDSGSHAKVWLSLSQPAKHESDESERTLYERMRGDLRKNGRRAPNSPGSTRWRRSECLSQGERHLQEEKHYSTRDEDVMSKVVVAGRSLR